jgi:Domain of unknown function (DUF6894)
MFTDAIGNELSGAAEMRAVAAKQIREIRGAMSERVIFDCSGWSMVVVDAAGKTVFEISFDLKPPNRDVGDVSSRKAVRFGRY